MPVSSSFLLCRGKRRHSRTAFRPRTQRCRATRSRASVCRLHIGHVETVSKAKGVEQELILPIAVKAIGKSMVQVVEFDVIRKEDAATTDLLTLKGQAVYELIPSVPGIGR